MHANVLKICVYACKFCIFYAFFLCKSGKLNFLKSNNFVANQPKVPEYPVKFIHEPLFFSNTNFLK